MPPRHDRYRSAGRKRLSHNPPLLYRRPRPAATTPTASDYRLPAFSRHQHQRSCPLALRGHDHRVTPGPSLPNPTHPGQAAPGGGLRRKRPVLSRRTTSLPIWGHFPPFYRFDPMSRFRASPSRRHLSKHPDHSFTAIRALGANLDESDWRAFGSQKICAGWTASRVETIVEELCEHASEWGDFTDPKLLQRRRYSKN